jgi:hypothetical protein
MTKLPHAHFTKVHASSRCHQVPYFKGLKSTVLGHLSRTWTRYLAALMPNRRRAPPSAGVQTRLPTRARATSQLSHSVSRECCRECITRNDSRIIVYLEDVQPTRDTRGVVDRQRASPIYAAATISVKFTGHWQP